LKKTGFLAGLIAVSLLLSAVSLIQATEQIYIEDFEGYSSQIQMERAFSAWQDGAAVNLSLVSLQSEYDNAVLRVDVLSPHPKTGVQYASFYHVLSSADRDWRGASAVQFWVFNPTSEDLPLTLNFKEEYNEYWAVGQDGVYYLQDEQGILLQQDIHYGNLQIPADFTGTVTVPLVFFSVPEWNTARGDEVLDLERIESFAFGSNTGDDLQRRFYLDDIAVLGGIEFTRFEILGPSAIRVPLSGEHREQYLALVSDLMQDRSEQIAVTWEILSAPDTSITVEEGGWLVVPAAVAGGDLVLRASLPGESGAAAMFTVLIATTASEGAESIDEAGERQAQSTAEDSGDAAYDQFSQAFETWAQEYRSLYILLAVGAVLLVLFLLSVLQRKLK